MRTRRPCLWRRWQHRSADLVGVDLVRGGDGTAAAFTLFPHFIDISNLRIAFVIILIKDQSAATTGQFIVGIELSLKFNTLATPTENNRGRINLPIFITDGVDAGVVAVLDNDAVGDSVEGHAGTCGAGEGFRGGADVKGRLRLLDVNEGGQGIAVPDHSALQSAVTVGFSEQAALEVVMVVGDDTVTVFDHAQVVAVVEIVADRAAVAIADSTAPAFLVSTIKDDFELSQTRKLGKNQGVSRMALV